MRREKGTWEAGQLEEEASASNHTAYALWLLWLLYVFNGVPGRFKDCIDAEHSPHGAGVSRERQCSYTTTYLNVSGKWRARVALTA